MVYAFLKKSPDVLLLKVKLCQAKNYLNNYPNKLFKIIVKQKVYASFTDNV